MAGACGMSAIARVAASRVCRSGSRSNPASTIAAADSAVFGSTIAATLRTPAAGCLKRGSHGTAAPHLAGPVQGAESVQGPDRMHRPAVDPDRIDSRVADEGEQLGHDILLPALDEEALRVIRQNMLSAERAATSPAGSFFEITHRFAGGALRYEMR